MFKIFDFVKSGVIIGDDVQKVFQVVKENNFVLLVVNCVGIDFINVVLEIVVKVKVLVIVQFFNGGVFFIVGKGVKIDVFQGVVILGVIFGVYYVYQMVEYYGVLVILYIDYCVKKLLLWIDGLLDVGEKYFVVIGKLLFFFYMIDLFEEFLYENIEICFKYLVCMFKIGMILEIELGCIGGEEDGVDNSYMDVFVLYIQLEDVDYVYIELSKISLCFIIVVFFGNVYGVYKLGNVVLILIILCDFQDYVFKKYNLLYNSLNFVFYGGFGFIVQEIKDFVSYGVVKMNIDIDI